MTTSVLSLPRRDEPNFFTSLVLLVFHIGAIAALFMFSWRALAITAFLYWMTIGLGISLGYHRLHTHRSYQIPLGLEYFFALCGALTLEGGPIFWVATHRIHHQKSDQPGDPHSPRDGAWWAHMGWILFGETNHNNTKMMSKYAPDLAKHKFYVWLNNYHWLPTIILAAILFAIGGLPWSCGASASASRLDCIPPGWSIRPRTYGASAASIPRTIRAIAGGSPC